MSVVYFLGRFHIVVLHLPIAFVLAALGFDWLVRREPYRHLERARTVLWALASASAAGTALLGLLHYQEGGFQGASAVVHLYSGIVLALLTSAAWLAQLRAPRLYARHLATATGALLVALVVTAHSGGNLTHGTTFLVEYAPQPIRTLAGLEAPRPPVTDLAQADPFHDVVRPILQQQCVSCHGNEKRKAGLNLTSFETLMAGGDGGPPVVPGDPGKSALVRVLTLPEGDEMRMPGEGRPPLSESEIRILTWWVESGAPIDTTLAELSVSPDLEPVLSAAVGLTGGPAAPVAATAALDTALTAALDQQGFLVRPVSLSDSVLAVAPVAPGTPVSDAQLRALAEQAEHVVDLDLAHSGVTDQQLEIIGQLTALARLNVQGNEISDAGVRALAGLHNLTVLNLYGNRGVTDAALRVIQELPALERVYLWGTRVTPQGAAELRRRKPGLQIDIGAATASGAPILPLARPVRIHG